MKKDLLKLLDLTSEDILEILDTADQLKAKGTQLEMKVQSNRFTIDELDAGTAYTLYYLFFFNY